MVSTRGKPSHLKLNNKFQYNEPVVTFEGTLASSAQESREKTDNGPRGLRYCP